jgi:hypothetical protein
VLGIRFESSAYGYIKQHLPSNPTASCEVSTWQYAKLWECNSSRVRYLYSSSSSTWLETPLNSRIREIKEHYRSNYHLRHLLFWLRIGSIKSRTLETSPSWNQVSFGKFQPHLRILVVTGRQDDNGTGA